MKGKRYLQTANSTAATVDGTSREVGSAMVAGRGYVFVSSTACWIKQGPTTTITAAANTAANCYVPANTIVDIHGSNGNALAVIQHSGAGQASLTPFDEI